MWVRGEERETKVVRTHFEKSLEAGVTHAEVHVGVYVVCNYELERELALGLWSFLLVLV